MTSLLAPVIACHHWISVCAAASLAAKSIAPAASQPNLACFFIAISSIGPESSCDAVALPHYSLVSATERSPTAGAGLEALAGAQALRALARRALWLA